MKKSLLSFSILLLFSYACNSSANENKVIQDSVIAVHDEVMPLMGDFVRNSIKIDTLLHELPLLKEQNLSLDTAQARVELVALKGKLDQATESMNDWMHAFEVDHEGKSKTEIAEYLQQELVKIKEVETKFKAASIESTSILEKYNKK